MADTKKSTKKEESKTTSSNLVYTGSVVAKVMSGKKVVRTIKQHNEGTVWLFQVLAAALIGNDNRVNMPRFLDAYKENGNSALAYKVALTGKYISEIKAEDEVIGWKAVFRCMIPYSSVSSDAVISRLSLFSNQTDETGDSTKLATLDLVGDNKIKLSNNQNLLIEWSLSISNVSQPQNQTEQAGGNA